MLVVFFAFLLFCRELHAHQTHCSTSTTKLTSKDRGRKVEAQIITRITALRNIERRIKGTHNSQSPLHRCRSWRKKIGTKFSTTECRKLLRGPRCTSSFLWRSGTTSSLTFSLQFWLRVSRLMWVYHNDADFIGYFSLIGFYPRDAR